MPSLMSYLTGFGLASGVGAKAAIPVLMLGGLHYTEWFELSERFAWIASPPVMIVLAVGPLFGLTALFRLVPKNLRLKSQ